MKRRSNVIEIDLVARYEERRAALEAEEKLKALNAKKNAKNAKDAKTKNLKNRNVRDASPSKGRKSVAASSKNKKPTLDTGARRLSAKSPKSAASKSQTKPTEAAPVATVIKRKAKATQTVDLSASVEIDISSSKKQQLRGKSEVASSSSPRKANQALRTKRKMKTATVEAKIEAEQLTGRSANEVAPKRVNAIAEKPTTSRRTPHRVPDRKRTTVLLAPRVTKLARSADDSSVMLTNTDDHSRTSVTGESMIKFLEETARERNLSLAGPRGRVCKLALMGIQKARAANKTNMKADPSEDIAQKKTANITKALRKKPSANTVTARGKEKKMPRTPSQIRKAKATAEQRALEQQNVAEIIEMVLNSSKLKSIPSTEIQQPSKSVTVKKPLVQKSKDGTKGAQPKSRITIASSVPLGKATVQPKTDTISKMAQKTVSTNSASPVESSKTASKTIVASKKAAKTPRQSLAPKTARKKQTPRAGEKLKNQVEPQKTESKTLEVAMPREAKSKSKKQSVSTNKKEEEIADETQKEDKRLHLRVGTYSDNITWDVDIEPDKTVWELKILLQTFPNFSTPPDAHHLYYNMTRLKDKDILGQTDFSEGLSLYSLKKYPSPWKCI